MELPGCTAKELYGITKEEAHEKGICVDCKEPALPKCYSVAGRDEYRISGLCEQCFDAMFTDEEPCDTEMFEANPF